MKLNIQMFADGEVIIPVNLDAKGFDRQIAKCEYELEELEETYKLALKDPNWDKKDLMDMEAEMQNLNNKIISLRGQQAKLNETVKEYDGTVGKTIGKIGKMGLAIFGIRSAYRLILSSANELASQNDALAGKLQAIKGSLANALAPVVEVVVNLVYKLLSYLNVITKTFYGVDLFKKTSKSAKSAVGSAKKLSKVLASFDEMNILGDNTTASGGGGGGTDVKAPEPIDTSNFQKAVDNFTKMWNDILKIDREEAKKLFLNGDDTWGAMKLLVFDYVQGSIKELNGLGTSAKGVWDLIEGYATDDQEKIDKGQKELIDGIKQYWEGFKQKVKGVLEFPYNFGITMGTKIRNLINEKIVQPIKDKIDEIKNKLKDNFKDGFWKGIANTLIDILNKAVDKINDKLKLKIGSTLASVLGAIGVKVQAGTYQLFSIPHIPKLAKGGIINMPGRGVPIAMGGERGQEGVIPLTDSQQMALLGEAIGKYITINATIQNTMNGRVISRELQKIQNENSFASNI